MYGMKEWWVWLLLPEPPVRNQNMLQAQFLDIAGWGPGKVHSYNPVSQWFLLMFGEQASWTLGMESRLFSRRFIALCSKKWCLSTIDTEGLCFANGKSYRLLIKSQKQQFQNFFCHRSIQWNAVSGLEPSWNTRYSCHLSPFKGWWLDVKWLVGLPSLYFLHVFLSCVIVGRARLYSSNEILNPSKSWEATDSCMVRIAGLGMSLRMIRCLCVDNSNYDTCIFLCIYIFIYIQSQSCSILGF